MRLSSAQLDRSKRSLPCRKQNNSDRGFSPVGNRKREDMGMDKKDIEDVALTAIVALCCPFTILLPPFNKVLKEDETEE